MDVVPCNSFLFVVPYKSKTEIRNVGTSRETYLKKDLEGDADTKTPLVTNFHSQMLERIGIINIAELVYVQPATMLNGYPFEKLGL